MALIIDNKFELGEKVYLVTDKEQLLRMITGIKLCADQGVLYDLMCGTLVSCHYDIEIQREKDQMMATTN